jgi:electron transport complex protein RnfG
MKKSQGKMLHAAVILTLFAFTGTALLSMTHKATIDKIAENERQAILRALNSVVPADSHDNDLLYDFVDVSSPELLGSPDPVTVYLATKQGQPVAAVFSTIAPNGYSGTIKLLVGVSIDDQITGVRVVNHKETPGLGDAIDADRSDWILGFSGKSLQQPSLQKWKVKKDGGYFDQFTGATISPRAVVMAVKNTLLYFKAHKQELFADTKPESTDDI